MSVSPVDDSKGTNGPKAKRLVSLGWQILRSRLLWLLLMFGSGAVVGSALTILEIKRLRTAMMSHPEAMIDRLTSDIRRDAELNDEETSRIRAIVADHHRRMMIILPQIGEELDILQHDVASVLTPTQRERWEPKFKQFRQHMFP